MTIKNTSLLIIAAILLRNIVAVTPATADVITCHFTEPFIETTYSTNTNDLVVTDESSNKIISTYKVSLQIIAGNKFELWNDKGAPVQKLEVNFKGSDGMSESTFPYDVEFIPMHLRGGCTSYHLH